MSAQAVVDESSNYLVRFFALVRLSLAQLVRPPSHSWRAEAARRSARHGLLLVAILGAAIVALMYALDVTEIGLMPPRGTLSLWPVRILTDFGKSAYVLWLLAGMLFAVAIISPRLRATSRSLLLGFGTRLQFLFFAVLVPVLTGEAIKWVVGRGRPRREVYSADSGKRQGLRTRSEQLHRVRTAPELAAETHQAEFALWRALQRADRLAGQLQSRATLNRLWPV